MVNLVKDISTLTTIPVATLQKFVSLSESIISHAVFELVNTDNNITSINIGIGVLNIKVEAQSIQYKFIPSNKLEQLVRDTVVTKKSPLVTQVEDKLKDKVLNVYKELL